MNLKVIGTGCEDCDRLYENTKQAIAQLGIEAELEKVEDLMEIVKLGVMTAPSPVSYTHLDVYKRQLLLRAALHRIRAAGIVSGANNFQEVN